MNRIRVTALAAALITSATVATASTTAAGGLSIAPAVLEHAAQVGDVGQIRVANDSAQAVAVTVAARPWIQARSGAVRADGRRRLGQMRLSATSFTLQPGEQRSVSATLLARPGSGSLYGALDVVGTPQGAAPRSGVRVRYRLLGGLRLNPVGGQRRLRVRVGSARADARGAVVPVRNTGNTVEPLTGSVRLSGAAGTLRASFGQHRVLPGGLVDLRLRDGRLQAGRYTAAITLRQGGRRVASVRRTFTVR